MTLGRYRIVRGRRAPDDPLPAGIRQDTRKHTQHVLRPDADAVAALLAEPTAAAFRAFASCYQRLLADRFAADPEPFRRLAELARSSDVWLGCNCPTAKVPDVANCHTVHALRFMQARFPELTVVLPAGLSR